MGHRYAKVSIGDPPQEIEMDLNMLVSDFYVVTTSSRVGSRFDEFFSKSYGEPLLSSALAAKDSQLIDFCSSAQQQAPLSHVRASYRCFSSSHYRQNYDIGFHALQTM